MCVASNYESANDRAGQPSKRRTRLHESRASFLKIAVALLPLWLFGSSEKLYLVGCVVY